MEAARSKGMQTKERLQVLVAVRMDVSEGSAVSDGEAEPRTLRSRASKQHNCRGEEWMFQNG